MKFRMSVVILFWIAAARAEVVRVESVQDVSGFLDAEVTQSDGKTLHMQIDGVGALRNPA